MFILVASVVVSSANNCVEKVAVDRDGFLVTVNAVAVDRRVRRRNFMMVRFDRCWF